MKHTTTPTNLATTERAASCIGGLALLGNGLRTRNLGGALQVVVGGIALLRGVTGHCKLKQLMGKSYPSNTLKRNRYSHIPLDADVHNPKVEPSQELETVATPMDPKTHPGIP